MAEVLLALADGRDVAALSEQLHDELLRGVLRETAHKHCLAPRGAVSRGRRRQVCSKDAQQSQKEDSGAVGESHGDAQLFQMMIQMCHNHRNDPALRMNCYILTEVVKTMQNNCLSNGQRTQVLMKCSIKWFWQGSGAPWISCLLFSHKRGKEMYVRLFVKSIMEMFQNKDRKGAGAH